MFVTAPYQASPPKARAGVTSAASRILLALAAFCLIFMLPHISASAYAGKYDTDAWQGKFRYGAFSTLISSHIMGTEFKDLIIDLSKPLPDNIDDRKRKIDEIREKISNFAARYNNLTDDEIDKIIQYAQKDMTDSIYEEERSIVWTVEQNNAFKEGMKKNKTLAPVDNIIQHDQFISYNFQFNTHRGLYNIAYGIPQNSLAAIVNAYVVGIRSVEFDVLATKDNVNVVIHDLVTNSLDGSYTEDQKFVEQVNFENIKNTHVNIVDPTAENPSFKKTGIENIMPTEQVVSIVGDLLPEMTLYVDARNDAPASFIHFLVQNPHYKNSVVLKIYPFRFHHGRTDLVKRYAEIYGTDLTATEDAIRLLNPHVLLAIGNAETEAMVDDTSPHLNNFNWDDFKNLTSSLPFSQNSTHSQNSFDGHVIFSKADLEKIETQTYNMFRWTMGFTDITNALVFQMSAIPALSPVLRRNDKAEYDAMGSENRIKAAVHENFMELYNQVMAENLKISISGMNLRSRIKNARFGLSDRYQDFVVAEREDYADIAKQDTVKSYAISMTGIFAPAESYANKKMQSTKAMMDRIHELNSQTQTRTSYATTDLPTDLRMAFMGLLGTHDLPDDLKYRPSSLIKEKHMPHPLQFELPAWTLSIKKTD